MNDIDNSLPLNTNKSDIEIDDKVSFYRQKLFDAKNIDFAVESEIFFDQAFFNNDYFNDVRKDNKKNNNNSNKKKSLLFYVFILLFYLK
jgi:hypothetical protein